MENQQINQIKFEDYKEACLNFSEDTKDWYNLEERQHYKNQGNEWKESSDGADSDLDVSWCFHLSSNEIENKIIDKFNEEIESLIDCLDEDDEEHQEWIKILNLKKIKK